MDRYDKEIQFILDSPNPSRTIQNNWCSASPLFSLVALSNIIATHVAKYHVGCLTMIRKGTCSAFGTKIEPNLELTAEILGDERIPCNINEIQINKENLNVFAEWQRKLDKIYGR